MFFVTLAQSSAGEDVGKKIKFMSERRMFDLNTFKKSESNRGAPSSQSAPSIVSEKKKVSTKPLTFNDGELSSRMTELAQRITGTSPERNQLPQLQHGEENYEETLEERAKRYRRQLGYQNVLKTAIEDPQYRELLSVVITTSSLS
jgi:hypothetical protein